MAKIDKKEAERLESLVPNKKFCPAPFMHTYINANNRGYKLCCMSHVIGRWDTESSLKDQHEEFWSGETMQEIRQSFLDGKMPQSCDCLLYTSPSPRDATLSRMPSSA